MNKTDAIPIPVWLVVVVQSWKINEPFQWQHHRQEDAEATARWLSDRYGAVVYVAKIITQFHKEVQRESYE